MNSLEKNAKLCHDIWSHWMNYILTQGEYIEKKGEEVSFSIPIDKINCWKMQMLTEYEDLSEEEKDSDRRIAKRLV